MKVGRLVSEICLWTDRRTDTVISQYSTPLSKLLLDNSILDGKIVPEMTYFALSGPLNHQSTSSGGTVMSRTHSLLSRKSDTLTTRPPQQSVVDGR